jgi:hypothetical protein
MTGASRTHPIVLVNCRQLFVIFLDVYEVLREHVKFDDEPRRSHGGRIRCHPPTHRQINGTLQVVGLDEKLSLYRPVICGVHGRVGAERVREPLPHRGSELTLMYPPHQDWPRHHHDNFPSASSSRFTRGLLVLSASRPSVHPRTDETLR